MGSVQFSQVPSVDMRHSPVQGSGDFQSRVAPPPSLLLHRGQLFAGRFSINGLLDHGGMGSIYMARDGITGEQVCLKLIRPEFTNTPEAVDRFMQEGKLARRLSHPNVSRVFDIDTKDGVCFISMEYAHGMNLRQWLNRRYAQNRAVRMLDVMWVARRLLGALDYVHRRGVVHRDVKPENIVIAAGADGADKDLKLVDFGLAAQVRADARGLHAPQRVGTWGYMAPEVYAGGEADARSDLYGVAVVLFEMLTGGLYVGDWQPMEQRRNIVSAAFENTLRSALSPWPTVRPTSALEMLRLLDIGARQPGQLARAGEASVVRVVPTSRTVTAVALHVLISALLLFVAVVVTGTRAEQKAQRVQRELSEANSRLEKSERAQRDLRNRIIDLEAVAQTPPPAGE